ncbi:hypothetical protein EZ428_06265 [Pedobacter frigiditerrae]|uniref:Uncharacterized protein n=1 Tax=Pedobacter frigiditerrae TaxID=2530452 RepID=A0A4R0N3E8_9SPHI|nr:hypothetical protein [Pedobacter frigiditerrae]TCC94371.1 hypothetical protein EZ428_06265 [Pedobacter frigiditerrae]
MINKELQIFATIKGIGSASGLFLKNNLLYVIGDNSSCLYEYNIKSKILNKIELLKGLKVLENIPKAKKPDFEVLCSFKNSLYILGSGSTPNRNLMVAYHLETKKIVQKNLSSIYAKVKSSCEIDNDNLNIEGAVFDGTNWFLFNRGNGNAKKNGVVKIYGSDLAKATKIEFSSIVLLKTDQKLVSFTDAVLYKNQIYFIAAAEDTKSTYHDGEILGSYLGSLNAETLSLNFIKQISTNQKFEGISFIKRSAMKLEFLVCEDRDIEILETVIYKLVV